MIKKVITLIFTSLLLGCNIDSHHQIYSLGSSVKKSNIVGNYSQQGGVEKTETIIEIEPGIYKYIGSYQNIISPEDLSEQEYKKISQITFLKGQLDKEFKNRIKNNCANEKDIKQCENYNYTIIKQKFYKKFKLYLIDLDSEMNNFDKKYEDFLKLFPTRINRDSFIFSLHKINDTFYSAQVIEILKEKDLSGQLDTRIDTVNKNSIILFEHNSINKNLVIFTNTNLCLSDKNMDMIKKYNINYRINRREGNGLNYVSQYVISEKPSNLQLFNKFLSECKIKSKENPIILEKVLKPLTIRNEDKKMMWQNSIDYNLKDFYEASQYCSTLLLEGFNDWKVPSFTEITTIQNKELTKLFDTKSDKEVYYWTILDVFDSSNKTGVGFKYVSGSPKVKPEGSDKKFFTRCVRHEAKPAILK